MDHCGVGIFVLLAAAAVAAGCGSKPPPEVPAGRATDLIYKKGRSITLPMQGAEWVRPNDRVDVLLFTLDPQTKEGMAMTVTQNHPVLAVGPMQAPVGDRPAMRDVSLMVLPEEAEILLLGVRNGVASVALRNPEDIAIQDERGRATLSTLFTGERINALLRKRTALLAPRKQAE